MSNIDFAMREIWVRARAGLFAIAFLELSGNSVITFSGSLRLSWSYRGAINKLDIAHNSQTSYMTSNMFSQPC